MNTTFTESQAQARPTQFLHWAVAGALVALLQGCAVVAVADAAVTVVATGVKVTAKAAGAVVDAVLPGDAKKADAPAKP